MKLMHLSRLGESLAMISTNPHYDETVQWRKANAQGVVFWLKEEWSTSWVLNHDHLS